MNGKSVWSRGSVTLVLIGAASLLLPHIAGCDEAQLAQEAYRRAVGFVATVGFDMSDVSPPSTVYQEQITLEGKYAPDAFGLFEPETHTVYVVAYDSAKFQTGSFLGQRASKELYISLITHEYIHYLNSLLCPDLFTPIDEMIAATGQFVTMSPDLRDSVLTSVAAMVFDSPTDICMGRYWSNPVGFLSGCYLYGRNRLGLIARFLRGCGPRLKDPLFVEEVR